MPTYDDELDILTLSSGRKIPCNLGIFGLSIRGGVFEPTYGCDGSVEDGNFSVEEKTEFADFNIAMWVKYKEQK